MTKSDLMDLLFMHHGLRRDESSEIVERIENSLKIIGDFYYAKIYRAAAERFRMNDWKKSVDQKLSNLVEISMLFMNQNNEKKSHLLELIIIFLILIEVVQIFN